MEVVTLEMMYSFGYKFDINYRYETSNSNSEYTFEQTITSFVLLLRSRVTRSNNILSCVELI